MRIKAWLDANAEEVLEIEDEEIRGLEGEALVHHIYTAHLDHWASERTHYGFEVVEDRRKEPHEDRLARFTE